MERKSKKEEKSNWKEKRKNGKQIALAFCSGLRFYQQQLERHGHNYFSFLSFIFISVCLSEECRWWFLVCCCLRKWHPRLECHAVRGLQGWASQKSHAQDLTEKPARDFHDKKSTGAILSHQLNRIAIPKFLRAGFAYKVHLGLSG